jgi:DNA-binding NtrC family response regulator
MPVEQQELLRWLRLGGDKTRVISTASAALWPMVRDGAFSPELYYRLNTVCIRVS